MFYRRAAIHALLAVSIPVQLVRAFAVNVSIDWGSEFVRTRTAATVEVDVMPFLARADFGGPFDAYYQALSDLGAEYVRYSPWFMNPRGVVPELTPSDCTPEKPATNWNSTYFDEIMRDFMHAVCGCAPTALYLAAVLHARQILCPLASLRTAIVGGGGRKPYAERVSQAKRRVRRMHPFGRATT